MKEVKDDLIKLIDKLYFSEKANKESKEYQNLEGLRQDLVTGINAHTFRPEKGESIRGVTSEDMPLYTLRVLNNTFLQGIDVASYSAEFQGIIEGLKGLHLKQDQEVYNNNAGETIEQNHDRINSAFKTCSSIISSKGIGATFTGSLSLYTKAGIESSRIHSDVDFYIEERDIFKFLKGLKENGQKFEFKDERLCQREGSFDRERGSISFLNGGTGGGHQCQVNLINPDSPKGFTEVGFFLSRQFKTETGDQSRFIKYYTDRSNGCERPIVVGQQMPENVTTSIDVPLENGEIAQVQAHSFEFNLKFKIGTPKARTKDVEDALMFTQNASLERFNLMQRQNGSIDKNYYLMEGQADIYQSLDNNGCVVDDRTTDEILIDGIFSTAESIVSLKEQLFSASEEEYASISEQIISLQNEMKNDYSQISTQNLIAGISSKMQIYQERFEMALPLGGLPSSEPLTDENIESFEHSFEQKQLAEDEVFKTLGLSQLEGQSDILSDSIIE